jgi:hypothetical protein
VGHGNNASIGAPTSLHEDETMIQSGTIHFGVKAEASPDWTLHMVPAETDESGRSRSGDDFRSADLAFPQRFPGTPTVVLSLAGIAALLPSAGTSSVTDLRVELDAEDVQPEEFNIRIRTATNTHLYDVWVNWIAHD